MATRLDACFDVTSVFLTLQTQQPIMHTEVDSSFHDGGHCEGIRGGVSVRSRRGDIGAEHVAKESRRFPDMPTLPSLVSYYFTVID